MSDEWLLNEARRRWKKRFPKTVQFMERMLSGKRSGSEVWCPSCERFHSPNAPLSTEDDDG